MFAGDSQLLLLTAAGEEGLDSGLWKGPGGGGGTDDGMLYPVWFPPFAAEGYCDHVASFPPALFLPPLPHP